MRRVVGWARAFALAGTCAGVRAAHADLRSDRPPDRERVYSPYEKATIEAALKRHDAEIETDPEGKVLEAIEIDRLEVIEERDPAPLFLNLLHATSRDYVVRREVLLTVGQPYFQALVDETARNLYANPKTISLVLCIPLKASRPDRVRLLVVTKDVWSLRAAWDAGAGAGGIERLVLEPTETNLAGTHQTVFARFLYRPLSYTLGAGYRIPRLDGRRIILSADSNVIFNKESGNPEGSYGTVSSYRPLYSALAPWGYGLTTTWDNEIVRRYSNARLATFPTTPAANQPSVPDQYRTRVLRHTASVTRSFGWRNKADFSLGAEANLRTARVENAAGFDAQALADYLAQRVPRSDTRVGPFFQIRSYRTDFAHLLDFETFALQEDHRLGPEAWIRIYPVTRALGSTRDFFGMLAALQYTVKLGDGLARAFVESVVEAQPSAVADAALEAGVHIAFPRLPFGRFVLDGVRLDRYRNFLNRSTIFGGESRLRGYPSGIFVGRHLLAGNAEFRTRSVEILASQLGLVGFYDGGDVPMRWEELAWHHSIGAGLRALFPQLDRAVFRADVGFPLERPLPRGVSPMSFYITFEQAFGAPTVGNVAAEGRPSSVGALGQ